MDNRAFYVVAGLILTLTVAALFLGLGLQRARAAEALAQEHRLQALVAERAAQEALETAESVDARTAERQPVAAAEPNTHDLAEKVRALDGLVRELVEIARSENAESRAAGEGLEGAFQSFLEWRREVQNAERAGELAEREE